MVLQQKLWRARLQANNKYGANRKWDGSRKRHRGRVILKLLTVIGIWAGQGEDACITTGTVEFPQRCVNNTNSSRLKKISAPGKSGVRGKRVG
jgi:hypothetical protein